MANVWVIQRRGRIIGIFTSYQRADEMAKVVRKPLAIVAYTLDSLNEWELREIQKEQSRD